MSSVVCQTYTVAITHRPFTVVNGLKVTNRVWPTFPKVNLSRRISMDTSKRAKESPMKVTEVNRKVFQVPQDKMTDREANFKDKQIK